MYRLNPTLRRAKLQKLLPKLIRPFKAATSRILYPAEGYTVNIDKALLVRAQPG